MNGWLIGGIVAFILVVLGMLGFRLWQSYLANKAGD